MWALYQTVVVKRKLRWKAKLSLYPSIYIPSPVVISLWAVTERMRSWIEVAKMSFLCRVARLSFRDRVRSSDIRRKFRVEPLLLHVEKN